VTQLRDDWSATAAPGALIALPSQQSGENAISERKR